MSNDFAWYSEELPQYWSYGVTDDGRVFFINDAHFYTTWSHPITGHPVQSGYHEDPKLPQGWQYDVDPHKKVYFINHTNQETSHNPPIIPAFSPPEYRLEEEMTQEKKVSETNTKLKFNTKTSSKSTLVKRDPDAPVEAEGYLLRQEGILKQWKKRWCVVSQHCLFCYEDSKEKNCLSSYILPGYSINSCYGEPGVLKKFAFKIAQKKMKTIYLAVDAYEDMERWIKILRTSADTNASSDKDDEVFQTRQPHNSLPVQLAQGSQSITSPDHMSRTMQNLSAPNDNFPRRSQSYHNFQKTSNRSALLNRNDSTGMQGHDRSSFHGSSMKGREISPSRQGFVEQRSRTPIYSPSEKSLKNSRNLTRSSGQLNSRSSVLGEQTWNDSYAAPLQSTQLPSHMQDHPSREYSVDGSNLQNRQSDLTYASFHWQPSIHGDSQRNSVNADGTGFEPQVNLNTQNSSWPTGDLTGLDEGVKTWKSFGKGSDMLESNSQLNNMSAVDGYGRSGTNKSELNKSFQNSLNNERITRTTPAFREQQQNSNSQQYSSIIRSKMPTPQELDPSQHQRSPLPQNAWQQQVPNFFPNRPSNINSPHIDRSSTSRSNRALQDFQPSAVSSQRHLDNISSISRYNSQPSSIIYNNQSHIGNFQQGYVNPPALKMTRGIVTGSADSINTLKTLPSSKSSSKNTYYLSGVGGERNNLGIGRKNSYLVVNGPNNDAVQPVRNSTGNGLSTPTWRNDMRSRNTALNFSAIKEDPEMPDDQVLTSRNLQDLQKKLASHTRLRLSISIQDLMGKSYEEAVLFLIQLKRSQSELNEMCERIKGKMIRSSSLQLLRSQGGTNDHADLQKQVKDVEKQIEATQPLINLLDNMLTMGSLFNGDSFMYASQYKKNQLEPGEIVPPKAMLEFNRVRQEALINKTQTGLNVAPVNKSQSFQIPAGDGREYHEDIEEELAKLQKLDALCQRLSYSVTSLRQDKAAIERTLQDIKENLASSTDRYTVERLTNQQKLLESDLNSVILQMADASKQLEETTAEQSKCADKVISMKGTLNQMMKDGAAGSNGGVSYQATSGPNNQKVRQMEVQIKKMADMLKGTSGKMSVISTDVTSLKRSKSSHSLPRKNDSSLTRNGRLPSEKLPSYLETDLDSNRTEDMLLGYTYEARQPEPTSSSRLSRKDEFYNRNEHQNPDMRSKSLSRDESKQYLSDASMNSYRLQQPLTSNQSMYNNTKNNGNQTMPNKIHTNHYNVNNQGIPKPSNMDRSFMGSYLDPKKNSSFMEPYSSSETPISLQTTNSQKGVPMAIDRYSPSSGLQSIRDQKSWPTSQTPQNKEIIFDENTIDQAVFQPPPQVSIPQRYYSDDMNEDGGSVVLNPMEEYHKRQKAEQVKKLLAAQSLQDFTVDELGRTEGDINERVRRELRDREEILEMKKNLAKQVTERSRNLAGM